MEHWAGRWNKQKTPPVLPTPRACRSDCPEGNTDRTTVFDPRRRHEEKHVDSQKINVLFALITHLVTRF